MQPQQQKAVSVEGHSQSKGLPANPLSITTIKALDTSANTNTELTNPYEAPRDRREIKPSRFMAELEKYRQYSDKQLNNVILLNLLITTPSCIAFTYVANVISRDISLPTPAISLEFCLAAPFFGALSILTLIAAAPPLIVALEKRFIKNDNKTQAKS